MDRRGGLCESLGAPGRQDNVSSCLGDSMCEGDTEEDDAPVTVKTRSPLLNLSKTGMICSPV